MWKKQVKQSKKSLNQEIKKVRLLVFVLLIWRFLPAQQKQIIQFEPLVVHTKHLNSKHEKGLYVYQQLLRHMQKSQKDVIAYLQGQKIPFASYCIANCIVAELDEEASAAVSGYAAVRSISNNDVFNVPRLTYENDRSGARDITWGLELIQADLVWDMGIRGQGVVIGGQDTGYEWDHEAIKRSYRGYFSEDSVDHNYHWHDAINEISPLHNDEVITDETNPCGLNVSSPCDDHGHGTHTMGTMVGEDPDTTLTIGVAPEAKWIGVRNMERGYGSPQTYLSGFEWFLAPTDLNGVNPDPTKAPHVINNSWACPEMEGCNADNFGLLRTAVENLRAAGIVVIASAGNNGSNGCGSVVNPPAIFDASLSIGAVNNRDSIASFSSSGPVMIEGFNQEKPDFTAPGSSVLSAAKGGGYRNASGTSMSGPHAAGVVALIISANPNLSGDVNAIEDILRATAVKRQAEESCSAELEANYNLVYGYGRLNALAAVEMAMTAVSNENITPKEIAIFPNPTLDRLTLNGINHQHLYMIYNVNGLLIKSGTTNGSIDVSDLMPGTYIGKVIKENSTLSFRFAKH